MRGFMTNAMMSSASAHGAEAASARANRSCNSIIAIISDVSLLASVFVVLAGLVISLGGLLPVALLIVVILPVILLVLAGRPLTHRERTPLS